MSVVRFIIISITGALFSPILLAETGLPIVSVLQDESGATRYSLTLQLLALMTVLTLLPSLLLMMTSFVRIVIVMSLLRQALGTAQTPPNQVIIGVALFLTFFYFCLLVSPGVSRCLQESTGVSRSHHESPGVPKKL